MSDITDAAFIVPYPLENVYGLGIAGPPVAEPAAAQTAAPPAQQSNEFIENEEIGQNVDIKV